MIAFYVLLGLTVAGFLLVLDRRDQRALHDRCEQREADRLQLAEMLQRVQAPQVAVAEHHHRVDPPVEPGGTMPMTDAEIAEAQGAVAVDAEQEKERLIAWMEAAENGVVQLQDGVMQ